MKKIKSLIDGKNIEFVSLDHKKFVNIIRKQKSNETFSNLASLMQSFEFGKERGSDLIFFVEDDYLFEEHSINECLLTYSRICSLLDSEIILCPSDYPFFYDSLYKTSLFIGNKHRWRNVGETLLTFMYSKSIFNKYKKEIREVGEKVNEPFEKPLHGIYKNVLCLAPIKSLSYHISRAVPDIGDEWKKIWDINYAKLLKFKS